MSASTYSDLVDAVPSYALKTAATLRLADHIANGHRYVAELADAAGADPAALERLMRYLCCREIFGWTDTIGYQLTPFSRLLLDEHPSRLRRSLDLDGHSGRIDQAIARLPDVIRSGRPSYPELFGKPFYDDYAQHPDLEADFAAVRARQAHLHGLDIAPHVVIPDGTHLVDVGGGTGALLLALIHGRDTLTGTVLDLPGLEHAATIAIGNSDAAKQITFTSGNFFDHVPGGDLHILSNTLFNWDDVRAQQILQNCVRSSSTGRIVVVEQVLDGDNTTEEELALDLRNLAINGGRQRTRDQFDRLARRAGLEITTETRLNYRSLSLLELGPAS